MPASKSASETSRQTSGARRRMRRARTTTSATDEITIKKVLLFLKEPNAAPVLVTLTKLKRSGITVRPGSSGRMNRKTKCFVHWSSAQSGSEIKRMNLTLILTDDFCHDALAPVAK